MRAVPASTRARRLRTTINQFHWHYVSGEGERTGPPTGDPTGHQHDVLRDEDNAIIGLGEAAGHTHEMSDDQIYRDEGGVHFPATDYGYVPDVGKPSTWQLRLTAEPGGAPTKSMVDAAVQALTKGSESRIKIPPGKITEVKRRVLDAYHITHSDSPLRQAGYTPPALLIDDDDVHEHGQDLKGVEVFRIGTWNGDKYTRKDLDDMVANFGKVGFQVPVKLGHKAESGEPAYGWVAKLRRVGDRLVADLRDIPDKIHEAIKDKRFDHVSAEIFWNIKRGGKTFRRVLKAVTLLGAETPAVSGLKPLRESFTDDEMSLVHAYTISISEGDVAHEYGARLAALLNRRIKADKRSRSDVVSAMAKAAGISVGTVNDILAGDIDRPPDRRLRGFARALGISFDSLRKAAGGKEESDDMNEELESQLRQQIDDLQAELADARANGQSGEDGTALKVQQMAEQIETLNAAVETARLERRNAQISEAVGKCTVRAFRNHLRALYALAIPVDGSDAPTVKFQTQDDKGDLVTSDTPAIKVIDDLVERVNKTSAHLFGEVTRATPPDGLRDWKPDGTPSEDPGAEIDRLTKDYMAKNNVADYAAAMNIVMQDPANRELVAEYATNGRH